MTGADEVLSFACEGETLHGILSRPAGAPSGVGVVVVVGGPQYRAGSHRQFTLFARAMAAQGHAVLRFDCRGMGDSEGAARSFEAFNADIGAAAAEMRRATGARHIVLWGLCDAASAILLYLDSLGEQAGIDGVVLLNPWVRTSAGLARAQVKHYYRQRLVQRDFWLKLLRGGVAGRALRDLLGNVRKASERRPQAQGSFQERMVRAWRSFKGPRLLLLSGQDLVAKEFLDYCASTPAAAGLLTLPGVERIDVAAADHTFSTAAWRAEVEQASAGWLQTQFGEGRP